ncbi:MULTISPECIES: DUF2239 family protein [Xanthomonas]|uniref:DUF2239 domain-containing protein n=2 Tax=Xanthomonas TaxID=338 RepID=A0ABT3DY41_9XANT|nr:MULTISPECIES: DUF2239 family protein [Xanthomonas]MCW0371767.1 hypothetical protein [Xanthomonas sacchari]MCW0400199.1 hypothetical protein [Xanthomonas sacchari]MCW0420130.1 hypothetical protein [Xanthomonas sacchari]MDQ7758560.1 DUF2239 family protein [Xanthomonas sontii]UYK74553.1 DUF2239 family protein [Xanthomonas sacchari]
MPDPLQMPSTAFAGHRMWMAGPLGEVALAAKRAVLAGETLLIFDDASGGIVDLDVRGSDAEVLARWSRPPASATERDGSGAVAAVVPDAGGHGRSRGRPKLGVVAREVTLLPRQWEWLASQPGGASAVLRRLVDEARKATQPRQQRRAAQERAYRFMQALAGDLPGYEEALRALFADDRAALEHRIAGWPADVRAYALHLAFDAPAGASSPPISGAPHA